MEDNRVGAAEARGSASGKTAVRTRSELERLYRLSDNKNTEDSMLEDYVDSDKEERLGVFLMRLRMRSNLAMRRTQ